MSRRVHHKPITISCVIIGNLAEKKNVYQFNISKRFSNCEVMSVFKANQLKYLIKKKGNIFLFKFAPFEHFVKSNQLFFCHTNKK